MRQQLIGNADPLRPKLPHRAVEIDAIIGQWPELMRLKASIEAGAVLPSVFCSVASLLIR
jgi:hypothetical protein